MKKIFLKLIMFFLVFILTIGLYFLPINFVFADTIIRFVTTPLIGWQSYDPTVHFCDSVFYNSNNGERLDYWGVDTTDLPEKSSVTSIDFCVRGTGTINANPDDTYEVDWTGQMGAEQCSNVPMSYYSSSPSISGNHDIWNVSDNSYSFRGGANDFQSSIDCLYVKINTSTSTPTPTNTPTPANTPTPTPTNIPTPTPTLIPTNTPTPTLSPTSIPVPTLMPIMPTAAPTPTETIIPLPTSILTPTPVIAVDGGTVAGTSVPVCNDQKPGSAPVLLSAVSSGINSITLNWVKSNDPVSYYLVTYGTSSGSQAYGNPNVGDKDTTSYTVNSLSGGATYYFKVRAGNGCAPGEFSNEASATPSGGFVTGIAPGFAAGVLGAQTQITPTTRPTGQALPSLIPSQALTEVPYQPGFFQRIRDFIRGIFWKIIFYFRPFFDY